MIEVEHSAYVIDTIIRSIGHVDAIFVLYAIYTLSYAFLVWMKWIAILFLSYHFAKL